MAQVALGAFGGLDILVNNAGIARRRRPEAMSLSDWNAILQTNLTAALVAAIVLATAALLAVGGGIGLLHAVTSPMACELILPWLAVEDRDAALGYVWQAVAALHVAYDNDRMSDLPEQETLSADALVDRALASRDEHAIKLTEAALRSFARTKDPALLLAAADACARLRA